MDKRLLKNSFKYSVKRSIPILIGFFPVGVAYGIMMHDAGLGIGWTALSSLFVYAGSLQMLMITFFKSSMPLVAIAFTSLLLNSRHMFYGISFIEKFKEYGAWKYFLIYGMPDESYSLLCSYVPIDGVSEKQVHIFSTALIWLYWIFFSVLGGIIGDMIPFDTTGIDFALTAFFTVILVDGFKSVKSKLPFVIALLSSAVSLALFGADNFLLPSLSATVAALIVLKGKVEHSDE